MTFYTSTTLYTRPCRREDLNMGKRTYRLVSHMKLSMKYWKEGGGYVIKCPELGVTTQGGTLARAKANLREAVSLHLETMRDFAFRPKKIKEEIAQKSC